MNPPATQETNSDLRTWEFTEPYPGVRFRFLSDVRFGLFQHVSRCGHLRRSPTYIMFVTVNTDLPLAFRGGSGAAVGGRYLAATPLILASRFRSPHWVTLRRASRTIPPLILDSPISRSVNVIGTSRTVKPSWMARHARSTWKQ